MDNDTAGIPQALQKPGRPVKAIRARLKGKEGRLRGNLMRKRIDFSAQMVIMGGPNLELGEAGVPESIAMNLTFPDRSTLLGEVSAPSQCGSRASHQSEVPNVDVVYDERPLDDSLLVDIPAPLPPADLACPAPLSGECLTGDRQTPAIEANTSRPSSLSLDSLTLPRLRGFFNKPRPKKHQVTQMFYQVVQAQGMVDP